MVQGVPKIAEYVYSKRILYIDQDSYRIPYSDIYDRSGQLWKVWINSFLFARSPSIASKPHFDYEIAYEPSMTMVDMQSRRATSCELPGRRLPEEQGWYVNVGEREGTVDSAFNGFYLPTSR